MRWRIAIAAGLGAVFTGFGLSSCRKTEVEQLVLGYLPPLTLPDSLTLTYGQRVQLDLPAEYQNLADVALTLSFRENAPLKVNPTDSLTTLVAKAITIDQATRKVTVDAGKLYPTSTTSDVSGVRLPRNYLATLTATSTTGFKPVKTRLKIRVVPAQLNIVEVPGTDAIPYAYGIYDNKPLRFTIDYAGLDATNTALVLDINGRPDGKLSITDRHLDVAADAGDPDRKYEWIYDVQPTLTKDGYRVAYRQFRIVLMPRPKFFFGTFYPGPDLTVLENRLVIQLGAAFTSKAPTFNPAKYRGRYALQSITKDGQPFPDPQKIFGVDAATGQVSVQPNTVLTEGEYKIVVQTQATTGLLLTADLTLVLEQ